jgi:hypothetical protein
MKRQEATCDSVGCFYLRDDGCEQLLRDGGVASAGVLGSGSLQSRRRHGVHLDSCRYEHVDTHEKQGPSTFYFPSPNKKGLQPLKYCANFSKNPILDLLITEHECTTVWQEKPGRLEEKILDKPGQKE